MWIVGDSPSASENGSWNHLNQDINIPHDLSYRGYLISNNGPSLIYLFAFVADLSDVGNSV